VYWAAAGASGVEVAVGRVRVWMAGGQRVLLLEGSRPPKRKALLWERTVRLWRERVRGLWLLEGGGG
jgi:hypothetical protein